MARNIPKIEQQVLESTDHRWPLEFQLALGCWWWLSWIQYCYCRSDRPHPSRPWPLLAKFRNHKTSTHSIVICTDFHHSSMIPIASLRVWFCLTNLVECQELRDPTHLRSLRQTRRFIWRQILILWLRSGFECYKMLSRGMPSSSCSAETTKSPHFKDGWLRSSMVTPRNVGVCS